MATAAAAVTPALVLPVGDAAASSTSDRRSTSQRRCKRWCLGGALYRDYDPLVLGANRRPTGQGAYYAYWRAGADAAAAAAIRYLTLTT